MIQLHTVETNLRLRHHLRFDDRDLKANHKGALSARQARMLWRKMALSFRTFIACFVMTAFLLWYIGIVPGDNYKLSAQCFYTVLGLLLATFFAMTGLYFTLEAQFALYGDIRSGQVLSYKGSVDIDPYVPRGESSWDAQIAITTEKKETLRLFLPSQARDLMVPRYVYQLYYTPHSKTVVALEPVPEESPRPKQPIMAKPQHLPRTTRRERRQARQTAD